MLWIRRGAPAPAGANVAEARRLLATRGWADHDGDGALDRNGSPLTLTMLLPISSATRLQIAQQVQEQLRKIGIRIELQGVEFALYTKRRTTGRFDVDFAAAGQDPSPTGLAQSWSCAGGFNFARFCDPAVDSLIEVATFATGSAPQAWQAVLRQIEADAPAVFMYSPTFFAVVDRRFGNVRIRPESLWLGVREWTVAGSH
jgi:peptide/nickel transport system substrate-binding protein